MSVLTDFLFIVFGWFAFQMLVSGIINWLSRGFFTKWLSVRLSQGKKYLVRVWTLNGMYYRAGKVDGAILIYKDRTKNKRALMITGDSVYRSYGVDCIEVDEEKNAVRVVTRKGIEELAKQEPIKVSGGFASIEGFDAVQFDNLLVRAVQLARLMDPKIKIILILVLLVGLLALAGVYFSYQANDNVKALLELTAQGGPVI